MSRRRSKVCIARYEWCAESFGKHDVCGIVCRKIMPELPNPEQQHELRIACNSEVNQILNRASDALV
jgi:hypothetical protein